MKKLKIKWQKCLSFIKLPDGTIKEVSLCEALNYEKQMKHADVEIDKIVNN